MSEIPQNFEFEDNGEQYSSYAEELAKILALPDEGERTPDFQPEAKPVRSIEDFYNNPELITPEVRDKVEKAIQAVVDDPIASSVWVPPSTKIPVDEMGIIRIDGLDLQNLPPSVIVTESEEKYKEVVAEFNMVYGSSSENATKMADHMSSRAETQKELAPGSKVQYGFKFQPSPSEGHSFNVVPFTTPANYENTKIGHAAILAHPEEITDENIMMLRQLGYEDLGALAERLEMYNSVGFNYPMPKWYKGQ